jgi:hypothetical protein
MADELLKQLTDWMGLKTRLSLQFSTGIFLMTVAGELYPMNETLDGFYFTTRSREISAVGNSIA